MSSLRDFSISDASFLYGRPSARGFTVFGSLFVVVLFFTILHNKKIVKHSNTFASENVKKNSNSVWFDLQPVQITKGGGWVGGGSI